MQGNGPAQDSSLSASPPVTATEVNAALARILASDAFAALERPSRFLRHLVENALNGQSAALKESLIGIHVFGREAGWDPRADPIVRQEAARLRKRLARYYLTDSPEVRIELPVGTYVPLFHRVSVMLPPVEEPPQIPEEPSSLPAAPKPPRRSWLWLVAALVLLAAFAVTWRALQPPLASKPLSIVVLPFTNLGGDPAKQYFADGMTDEITDRLTRIPSLKVLARASAFAFKGKTVDVRDLGRKLGVSHVLEGSVEWFGEEIRISGHLERVSDGSHVWSGTYERSAKDFLAVQSELADAVSRTLQLDAGIRPGLHVPVEEAHELYLQAVFDMQNQVPESLRKAEAALQESVRIDPEYAAAWFQLGLAKFNSSSVNGRMRTPAEVAEVRSLYRKALQLDPDLLDVHAQLAFIAMINDWDWAGAERELRLASRNGPRAFVESTWALLLSYHGRFREADERIAAARTLDPAGATTLLYLGAIRHWEGRFAEAIAIWQQLLERSPNQLNPRIMLNFSYIEAGQAGLALSNIRTWESKTRTLGFLEVMALAHLGRRQEGLRLLRQLEAKFEDSSTFRQWFALAWASLGDHAQTVKWLERSAALHEFQVLNMAVNPAFAEMRNDPPFRALATRIGL
jgi:TolB-like protein/Tfp pilus assembly protein PilF